MNNRDFFATHPVFTVQEFDQFLQKTGRATEYNRQRMLGYYRQQGRLVLIRNGMYGVIPLGSDAITYPIDSYLVAAHLTPDAAIGYHSALAFHGVAHSLREERIVITKHPLVRPFLFRGVTYRTVLLPKTLIEQSEEEFGVERQERQGVELRVASLERTLVDSLDRLRLGGGWEEVRRSYEAVPYLDLAKVVRYALLLNNATTIAKVGYFLEEQRERWMVSEDYLTPLRAHRPRQPHYLDRSRQEPVRMVKDWNLMVPEHIQDRDWEENGELIA